MLKFNIVVLENLWPPRLLWGFRDTNILQIPWRWLGQLSKPTAKNSGSCVGGGGAFATSDIYLMVESIDIWKTFVLQIKLLILNVKQWELKCSDAAGHLENCSLIRKLRAAHLCCKRFRHPLYGYPSWPWHPGLLEYGTETFHALPPRCWLISLRIPACSAICEVPPCPAW